MLSTVASGLLDGAGLVVILFFLLVQTMTAALLIAALPSHWRHWDPAEDEPLAAALKSDALPTVSVVVTGRADQRVLLESVRALLTLEYPRHEVVLVHDGEASGLLPALVAAFDLYQVPPAVLVSVPTGAVRGYFRSRSLGKLFVIDKAHAGHADDLNAALNASRFPYILTLDIGTRLGADALTRLMRPFLLGERIAAVAAGVRIREGGSDAGGGGARTSGGWLGGARTIEALRDSVFARLGWNPLGGLLSSSGDVLLHRRDHLLEIEGFRAGAADAELDLVLRLRSYLRGQQLPHAIPAIPDPVAWTSAHDSSKAVGWRHAFIQRGRIAALLAWRAVAATGGPEPRMRARLALGIAVLAPIAEAIGYLLLGAALVRSGLRDPFVSVFLVAVPGYALLLSLWAVAMDRMSSRGSASERSLARMWAYAVAEQLGYRQWVMWRRLRATGSALLGRHRSEPERAAARAVTDEPSAADAGAR